jgi:hypothetical protein
MLMHNSACLQGPVTRNRAWWTLANVEVIDAPHSASGPRAADAPVRTELVERVRRDIAAGVYDTPEKLEIALSRLFEHLGL